MTYGKSNYDDIKKKFQQRQEQRESSGKYWKPKAPTDKTEQNKYLIRLLPPPANQTNWFFALGMHYRLDDGAGNTIAVVCPRLTVQERCPICEFTKPLWDGDERDKALARKIGPKRRYVSNIIDLKKPSEVKTWDYGEGVWTDLCSLNVGAAGIIPIDSPEEGHDISMTVGLKVTESGKFPQYTINFGSLKPSAIPDMKVVANLPDFKAMVIGDLKTYDELMALLKGEGPTTAAPDNASAAPVETPATQSKTEVPADGSQNAETQNLVERAQRALESRKAQS